MRYAAWCSEGIEDLTLDLLETDFLVTGLSTFPRGFVFEASEITSFKDTRYVDDMILIATTLSGVNRYRRSLKNIRLQCGKIDISERIKPLKNIRDIKGDSVNVTARYLGRRDYKKGEIIDAAKKGLLYKNPKLIFSDDADIQIIIDVNDIFSYCGIALKKKQMYELMKPKITRPGSIRSSLAHILCRLADVKKGMCILDPLCGSGTIVREAAILGAKITCGDIDPKACADAESNLSSEGMKTEVTVWNASSTGLDKKFDAIISNLPLKKQVDVKNMTYSEMTKEMYRLLNKGGKIVLIAPEKESISMAFKEIGLTLKDTFSLRNSGLESHILVFEDI